MGVPLSDVTIDDFEMWTAFLTYYGDLQLDSIDLWTPEQLEYGFIGASVIGETGVDYKSEIMRQFREILYRKRGARFKGLQEAMSDVTEGELRHWMAVLKTRGHSISQAQLRELKEAGTK
jgi:hypothetical protein